MSILYLEVKYARMVGSSIERWKVKKESPFHGNGRCPICGDSSTSKTKTRFHIREFSGTVFVSCFNCSYSTNLIRYLKTYQPSLYSEFVFERYRVIGSENTPIIQAPKVVLDDSVFVPIRKAAGGVFKLDLPFVSDLPKNDPVRLYMDARRLPEYPFLYAAEFYKFSSQFNEELEENYEKNQRDEARIVIPFFSPKGDCFAYQGRSLERNPSQKYITIIIDKKIPKIFGIDKINLKEPLTIVEGPLDNLFLNNSLASVNASLVATAKKLLPIVDKKNITLVYDCEPRNPVICKMYGEAIDAGYNIVIWPTSQTEKDINDLFLSGKNPNKVIADNTRSGLLARLEFDRWRRC